MSVHGEDCFEAFVYLDHYYPPVYWNIARGVFHSPDCLPDSKKIGLLSISMATMFLNSTADRLVSELWLEHIRSTFYSDNISRLRGIFVFDDLDSLAELWNNNNWGGHFSDEYLSDVGVSCKKSSRLDSNWISEIICENGQLMPEWEHAAHNYWRGIPHPDKSPIWERIIEGAITVWSMHSREKALREIQTIWPQSLNLLRYAIMCGSFRSFDGEIFPLIVPMEKSLQLLYCLRLAQRTDRAFMDSLNSFIRDNPQYSSSLRCEGEDRLPDLQGFGGEFTPTSKGKFGELTKQILTKLKEL